jgi:hypothetical protein
MGLLDKLLGKTGNMNLSGLELGKIDELVKMLGDNKSNVDFSADKLTGFQDLISKYLKSGKANNEIVEQLKNGLIQRFKGSKKSSVGIASDAQNIQNGIVDNILNELNKWLSKNK